MNILKNSVSREIVNQKGGNLFPKTLNIFKSTTQCIYENLALEEWIFRNQNIAKNGDALIIWRNKPAVVIGRYQNPWIEANVCYCQEKGIKIARRYSGGGAVYHDMGNLNISILTSHENHSRSNNLQNLAVQLNSDLPFLQPSKIIANSRDDLVFEPGGIKISGTAARISHGRAYHHFTLLVGANLEKLRYSLQSPLKEKIETTATRSVRANSVGYIAQKLAFQYPSFETMIEAAERSVLKAFSSKYMQNEIVEWNGTKQQKYPGIEETLALLKSEDWIYGKTPRFSLKLLDSHNEELRTVHVENGRIKESTNSEFPHGQSFHKAFLVSRYSELFLG